MGRLEQVSNLAILSQYLIKQYLMILSKKQSLMIQSKYYHRPNYSYSYPPGPGQNHQHFISYLPFDKCDGCSAAGAPFSQNRHFLGFISISEKSDSNSSLPCPETFKPKTFLEPTVLNGFWYLLLNTSCFTTFLSPSYCRTTGAMRGPGLLLDFI